MLSLELLEEAHRAETKKLKSFAVKLKKELADAKQKVCRPGVIVDKILARGSCHFGRDFNF